MTLNGWGQIVLILSLVFSRGGAARPLHRRRARRRCRTGSRRRSAASTRWPACIPAGRWTGETYAFALIALNAAHFLLLYVMLRLQWYLPLNPQGIAGMSPRLAFNTAMSFVTNTNWQAYAGEQALSYGSQMWGLTVHNFLSAATGIAAAAAVARAFAAGGLHGLGNFWADLTRITLYVLLPLSVAVAVALILCGVPADARRIGRGDDAGGRQAGHRPRPGRLPGGDQADRHQWRRVLQRQLGASLREPERALGRGGDLVGDPHPVRARGRVRLHRGRPAAGVRPVLDHGRGHGRVHRAGLRGRGGGQPAAHRARASIPSLGNMEGKEVRFGIPLSVLFAVTTTVTSVRRGDRHARQLHCRSRARCRSS